MRLHPGIVVTVGLASAAAWAQDASLDAWGVADGACAAAVPLDAGAGALEPDAGTQAEIGPTIEPSVQSAPDVVVTGRRPIVRDRAQDATLIGGQRVRDSAAASTFEAVAQAAGDIYVPARGVGIHGVANGATGGIRIRGLGGSPNSQVLVVEDDVPDYQGIFGHPIPDAYSPELIDEVLVIKGGDSTLYGTNAMGGVLVIRSRWREDEGQELLGDVAYGSFATTRQSVTGLVRAGDWDAAAAFRNLTTRGHRDGAGGNAMVGSAAVRYRLARGLRLSVRNKVTHVEGNDPGPVASPTTDHWFDVWRDNLSAQLVASRGKTRATLTPYLNLGVHRLYDGFYSHDTVGGTIAELELRPHATTNVLVGLSGQWVAGTVEERITGERPYVRDVLDGSVYGQVALRPLATLTLTAGGRLLQSNRYGSVPLYKAGGRWDLGGGFYVHGRVSRNFRQPTIRELYLPYPTANPDLRAESAVNSDLGTGFVSTHFELACSGYRTEARSMIKYFGVWPAAEVVNIDRIVIVGIEGRLAVKAVGPFTLSVAGDWQDVGRYTRQNPSAKLNFAIDATRDWGNRLLTGTLTGEWVHGLYMADYGRQPIDDVFVMDLSLRYRHTAVARGVTVEPYLLLRNLLDLRYAYVDGYPMPGFNLLAGLKVGI